jgi:PAS domain S-box-containing protein
VENHKDIDFVLVFGGLFLAADIFGLDYLLSLDMTVGVLYASVVSLGLFWPGRGYIFSAAIICSLLIGLGYYLSPQSGDLVEILVDRGLSLLSIWGVAVLCLYHKRTQLKKEELRDLLSSICRVQSQSLAKSYDPSLFKGILNTILSLTDSEIGVVGEIHKTPEGEPYFKPTANAMANMAWSEEVREMFSRPSAQGVEVYSMDALLGEVISTGQPLIVNDSGFKPGGGGIPLGHPLLKSFMGLPFYHGGQVLGIIGLANRPGGFSDDMVELLQPFLFTLANIILFIRRENEPEHASGMLEEMEKRLQEAQEKQTRTEEELTKNSSRQDSMERERQELEQALHKSIEQLKNFDQEKSEAIEALNESEARLKKMEEEQSRIEKAMQAEEEDLKKLAKTTGGWFWEMNLDGLYVYASSGVENILGFSSEEISNKKYFYELLGPEMREASQKALFPLMAEGAPLQRMVSEKETRDPGRTVYVETFGYPVLDETGKVKGYQGIENDVTERENTKNELRDQRLRNEQVLNVVREGIFGLDVEGNILFINSWGAQALGYTARELTGKNLSQIFNASRGDDAQRFRNNNPAASGDESSNFIGGLPDFSALWSGEKESFLKEIFWRKDGTCFDVELTGVPLWSGKRMVGMVAAFSEATASRENVDEGSEARLESPPTPVDTTQDAAAVKKEKPTLEAAEEKPGHPGNAGRDLHAVISHGLQDPLRKVLSFGERLKFNYDDQLDERGRSYLHRMDRAATQMQEVIDDLVLYAKVNTEDPVYKPLPLNEVIQEVLSFMEPEVMRAGGNIRVGTLPTVEADRRQMHQLFKNLISNALTFRKEDEPLLVSVQSRSLGGGVFDIMIEDNGTGIDESNLERIFRPFERLKGRQHLEGTGMGLALCRRIVRRHGGEISVESENQKGSTFIVTLPEKQTGDIS